MTAGVGDIAIQARYATIADHASVVASIQPKKVMTLVRAISKGLHRHAVGMELEKRT